MPSDEHERRELPADLQATHDALTRLADAWSGSIPPADRLTAFTRELPARLPVERRSAGAGEGAPNLTERFLQEIDAPTLGPVSRARPAGGAGRMLVGLAAVIIIVGLLATTLLRLSPAHTAHGRAPALMASATVPAPTPATAARLAEEPSREPPAGVWTTVASARLIPAPSDGRVVYKVDGAVASVSFNSGVTWRALTLPAFPQSAVTSESIALRVSDADARVLLLSMTLFVTSSNPASCPVGSRAPTAGTGAALHGGVLASGSPYCVANYASHDAGVSWTPMRLPANVTYPPSALNPGTIWQLGASLYGVNAVVAGFDINTSALLVSHDVGATWAYTGSAPAPTADALCSFLPSVAEDALYMVTAHHSCFDGSLGARDIWRSGDGGATWRRVSTRDAVFFELEGASPAPGGHGAWLYALQVTSAVATSAMFLAASEDGGVSWIQAPKLTQAPSPAAPQPINGTLADGSLVVAAFPPPSANPSATTPTTSQFFAWRPGDTAWRPLAAPLTANYAFHGDGSQPIALARGGSNALDTLWVIELDTNNAPQPMYTTHAYLIR